MQINHIKPLILRRACNVKLKCKRHLSEHKEKLPAALDYFITTPIFYVNASPHIGHLYTALVADAAYRFHRLLGLSRTVFCTGTDEHGTKIQQAASSAKTEPQVYCDAIAQEYKELFRKFDIQYSDFVRTTDDKHKLAVQHFWKVLASKGHIYEGEYAGWYCVSDEAFLTDTQLKTVTDKAGNEIKVSAESGRPVEWTEEKNFKFRLSKFQNDLLHWLKDENVVKPAKFHKQLTTWIQEGEMLQDVSVSRPKQRVYWAVPVPDSLDQSVYVWLDALVNYLTVVGYPNKISWPPDAQVLGKDILKFHGVFWPAFLIAAGLEPPRCLLVHSHWTVNDEKMSKSKGNVVCPFTTADIYTESGLRYFLLRESTPHSDANYSETKILRMLNAELADTLGNLLNRCCGKTVNPHQQFPVFNQQHFEQYCQQDAAPLIHSLTKLPDEVAEHFTGFNFYRGIEAIILTLHEANRFFEISQPWVLRKQLAFETHLNCVLHITMEALRICGIGLQPVIPKIAELLLDKLNIPNGERLWRYMKIQSWSVSDNAKHPKSVSSANVVLYRRIVAAKN